MVWRARWYFYIGDIYDRVKDLLSISGLSMSSFAPTMHYIFIYNIYVYCISITYHYYLYTVHAYMSRHPSCVYKYVCVFVLYRSPFFLCSRRAPSRKPPNNNRNESSVIIYTSIDTYYYIAYIIIWLFSYDDIDDEFHRCRNHRKLPPNNVRLRRFFLLYSPHFCILTHSHTLVLRCATYANILSY